ncbi:hypothetical protein OHA72_24580 [Dactylosporangium sp. NBC_01737]|uniref:hypothetical protein n=1 Tax=Dactylosporangium sp. NBC_01737 TaxID=2975959 RepID=UPI002E0D3271|nr:hypothetical protein OHA72_24580 [Dactylosporangium sp. NBC_01737]
MHQNVLHLGGTAGTLILAVYVIGGLITIAAGLLPGNATRFRLLCVLVGLTLSAWSAKVLFLGGVILVGLPILLVPATLTVAALIGTYRAYRPQRAPHLTPLRPHPAARTYTEPRPFQPAPAFPGALPLPAHATPAFAHATPPFGGAAPPPAHAAPALAHAAPASAHAAPASAHAAPAFGGAVLPTPAHAAPSLAHAAPAAPPFGGAEMTSAHAAPASERTAQTFARTAPAFTDAAATLTHADTAFAHAVPAFASPVTAFMGDAPAAAQASSAPAPVAAHVSQASAHAAPSAAHAAPLAAHAAPLASHAEPVTAHAGVRAHSAPGAAYNGAPRAAHVTHSATGTARSTQDVTWAMTQTQSLSAGVTQPRFHGHAIAPPAAFPAPPRFAPQPLHNVPSPRPAPDGYVTVHAQYPANHLQPSSSHPASHSSPVSHRPTQHPVRAQDPSWSGEAFEGQRVSVPQRNDTTMTSSHAVAPPTRMPLAPATDPSPLQPSAVRARHRAARSAG